MKIIINTRKNELKHLSIEVVLPIVFLSYHLMKNPTDTMGRDSSLSSERSVQIDENNNNHSTAFHKNTN